jgi:phage terminase large subunit-like protein
MSWQPRNAAERDAADRAVQFISLLTHTKGKWAGKPFDLLPWQRDIIRPVFGTLNPDGSRTIRTVYVEVPRKQGKSELAAAVALKLLFADKEPGGEVYGAANDRDQASIVFNVAGQMVRTNAALRSHSRVIDYSKRVVVTKGISEGSVYRAIPADAAGSHGFNASGVIFDEIHTQPNRDLWDVLTTATAARNQPLTFGITTAGYDRNSICWELHERARQIIEGVIVDPTWFAVIHAAPEEADWRDEQVWRDANPSFGITVPKEYFEQQAQQAITSPAYENTFRRLHLNQWTAQQSRFIPMRDWDACAGPVVEASLTGRTCYAGVDLASTTDLSALALVFPPADPNVGEYEVVMRFWAPESRLEERGSRDRVPYRHWVQTGFLEATEGNVIDYAAIEREIQKASLKYRLPQLAVDRLFNAEYLAQRIDDTGIEVERRGMGFLDMSFPTKELLRLILQRRIRHGGHPILRWMADNLMAEQDAAGNVKPSKAKSTQRIDGIVALILALDLALRHQDDEYDVLESVK